MINFNYPLIGGKLVDRRLKEIEEWEAKGIKIGKAKGIEIGKARGIEIGKSEGIEIGRAAGKEMGRAEGKEMGKAEGIEIGKAKGKEIGRAEERAKWSAWNNRRLEAEKAGVPFNEPPPDDSRAARRGAFTPCKRRAGTPPRSR